MNVKITTFLLASLWCLGCSASPVAVPDSLDTLNRFSNYGRNIAIDQAPGAITDIMTAVSDLMLWIREFQNSRYDKRPEKFVALFPDFIRRTVDANARLEGRPVRNDEREFIQQVKDIEQMVGTYNKEFQREFQRGGFNIPSRTY